MQDQFLKAEPIYQELIKLDDNNPFYYMDYGHCAIDYAWKIYFNGDRDDYIDGDPKNKEGAMPYFDIAIKNVIKSYMLFTDEQRCATHVLVFLNDLFGDLIEEGLMTNDDMLRYIDGADFSTYYCD